jgi:hypothetical protein
VYGPNEKIKKTGLNGLELEIASRILKITFRDTQNQTKSTECEIISISFCIIIIVREKELRLILRLASNTSSKQTKMMRYGLHMGFLIHILKCKKIY